MIKKVLFGLAAFAGLALPAMAQTEADNDIMYVVKNGKVVGQYEVGKDADYITFTRPETPQLGNFVQYGSSKEELKSAFVMKQGGYTYVFISVDEKIPTDYTAIMTGSSNFALVMVPDELLGQEIDITEYENNPDEAPMFQAYFYTSGEQAGGTGVYDIEDDIYSGGKLKVTLTDDKVTVTSNFTSIEAGNDFELSYDGSYVTASDQSDNTFVVDDVESKVRAAFYKDNGDKYDFYLTSGAIENAADLENAHQYVHVQLPLSLLDGTKLDITGNTVDFKLDFIDNIQEQTYNLSTGNVGKATGTVSVQLLTENTYKVAINIDNFGTGRSFSTTYDGEFMVYDLTKPNAYKLQNGDEVQIKSAVTTHSGSTTTVYLSSKEGITTTAGMADADIVVNVPDEFLTGGIKGFSGTETNAQISIAYDGETYSQANCGDKDDAKAIGGNVSMSFSGKTLTMDFNVYNIYKYGNANLSGHYEGPVSIGK